MREQRYAFEERILPDIGRYQLGITDFGTKTHHCIDLDQEVIEAHGVRAATTAFRDLVRRAIPRRPVLDPRDMKRSVLLADFAKDRPECVFRGQFGVVCSRWFSPTQTLIITERGPLPRIIDDKPVKITRHEFAAFPLFLGLVAYPVAELGDLLAEFAEAPPKESSCISTG